MPGRKARLFAAVALVNVAAASRAAADPAVGPGDFIAYSLGEAARRAAAGARSDELSRLAGMTRLVGVVAAPSGEIILVGKRVAHLPPLRLDDLVAALRSRLLHDEWPRVSIDRTAESDRTRRQAVRLSRGLAGTSFGLKIFEADVILKRYSLELLASAPGAPSYRALCQAEVLAAAARDGNPIAAVAWSRRGDASAAAEGLGGRAVLDEQAVASRFWFFPRDDYSVAGREGVFVVADLRVGVRRDVERLAPGQGGAPASDPAADRFAERFTAHLRAIARRNPALLELDGLYHMTGIAEAVYRLGGYERVGYFLRDYALPHVATPGEYDLLEAVGTFRRADGAVRLTKLSGGIELRAAVARLSDGDLGPLRAVVLAARPAPGTLWWRLPVRAWRLPSDAYFEDVPPPGQGEGPGPARIGFTIVRQSMDLAPPRPRRRSAVDVPPQDGATPRRYAGFPPPPPPLGGVVIAPAPRPKRTELGTDAREVERARPASGTLRWRVGGGTGRTP